MSLVAATEQAPNHRANRRLSSPWYLWATRASFALAGGLPWALPFARAKLSAGPIWPLLDAMYLPFCHRRPERTLAFWGEPMPLCSRCAGIALGLALGAVIAWPSPSLRVTRLLALVAVLLMLVDIVTQDLGLHPVWHASRLGTGVLAGYIFAIGLVAAIRRERSAPMSAPAG